MESLYVDPDPETHSRGYLLIALRTYGHMDHALGGHEESRVRVRPKEIICNQRKKVHTGMYVINRHVYATKEDSIRNIELKSLFFLMNIMIPAGSRDPKTTI